MLLRESRVEPKARLRDFSCAGASGSSGPRGFRGLGFKLSKGFKGAARASITGQCYKRFIGWQGSMKP